MSKSYNHVLVITNEDELKKQISNYLIEENYACSSSSLKDALEKIKENMPDLILCCISDNLSTFKEIKQYSLSIPIILLAKIKQIDLAREALEQGAIDCIITPIEDLFTLSSTIKRGLNHISALDENKSFRHELELLNAELTSSLQVLKEDQKAGRIVQKKLLPEKEYVFGEYKLSYNLKSSLFLSGDFVDYFELDENKLAFYLMDVAGHGCASAFVTILIKTILQGLIGDRLLYHPNQVLNLLNYEIISQEIGKHLTIIYCVFDKESKVLSYSSAGHHPKPIAIVDDELKLLETKGYPIGIVSKPEYEVKKINLGDKFSLNFLTDGILELLDGTEEQKENYLCSLAREGSGFLEDFFEKKFKEAENLPDDITLLNITAE